MIIGGYMARILVVDDEKDIVELISTNSPLKALELIGDSTNHFDQIICDVVMPSKNGIDFVKEVNRIPWFKGDITLMSSYTQALKDDLENVAVTHVLRKPFRLEDLLSLFQLEEKVKS
jgi:CheY-like chemotaxis protein